jgi:hypothetical protein
VSVAVVTQHTCATLPPALSLLCWRILHWRPRPPLLQRGRTENRSLLTVEATEDHPCQQAEARPERTYLPTTTAAENVCTWDTAKTVQSQVQPA